MAIYLGRKEVGMVIKVKTSDTSTQSTTNETTEETKKQ